MKQSVLGLHAHQTTKIMACVAVLALQAGTASAATAKTAGCDPQQFAGERHYVKVRMNGDRVASMHMIRTKDQKEVATSYPYGRMAAIPTPDTREQCMKVKDLKTVAASTSAAAGATTKSTQGLVIGWNPSTGRPLSPTACYNYTTGPPSDNHKSESFSSQNSASSVAAQTKVSATISGGFGAFSAGGHFSYSDQWQTSANSGSAYFNLSSIWKLSNTIHEKKPLTTQGENLLDSGQFPTLCGVQYLASVSGGMVATFSIAYSSSSATTKKAMDAGFKVSYGLDSVKAAYKAAKSDTSSSSYIRAKLTTIGGGSASNGLLTAFGDVDDCNPGNTSSSYSACKMFINGIVSAGSAAVKAFNKKASNVPSGEDLSFIALFPHGIAGVPGTPGPASPPNVTPGNDALKPYTTQLTQYLTLLNQIATLNNRASHLTKLIGTTYQPSSPIALDLTGYLGYLISTTPGDVSYDNNRQTLVANLEKCLKAKKSNVTTVCAPIINGGGTIESAYTWYDAEHGYPACTSGDHKEVCWLAQQNTIALQYAGTLLIERDFSEVPHDVLYVDQLPPWSTSPIGKPIGGKAALVAFADREFFTVKGNHFTAPNVSILPFENNTDLKDIYTSVQPPPATAFEWWGIDSGSNWYPQSSNAMGARTNWTTPTCGPTFEEPCPIGFTWSWPEYEKEAGHATVQQTTNPITGLFTAD